MTWEILSCTLTTNEHTTQLSLPNISERFATALTSAFIAL